MTDSGPAADGLDPRAQRDAVRDRYAEAATAAEGCIDGAATIADLCPGSATCMRRDLG